MWHELLQWVLAGAVVALVWAMAVMVRRGVLARRARAKAADEAYARKLAALSLAPKFSMDFLHPTPAPRRTFVRDAPVRTAPLLQRSQRELEAGVDPYIAMLGMDMAEVEVRAAAHVAGGGSFDGGGASADYAPPLGDFQPADLPSSGGSSE